MPKIEELVTYFHKNPDLFNELLEKMGLQAMPMDNEIFDAKELEKIKRELYSYPTNSMPDIEDGKVVEFKSLLGAI
jgi:hypothetical protein